MIKEFVDFKTHFETPQDTLKAVSTAVRDRIKHQMGYLNEGCGLVTTATVHVIVLIMTLSTLMMNVRYLDFTLIVLYLLSLILML